MHHSKNVTVFHAVAVVHFRHKGHAAAGKVKDARRNLHAAEDAVILRHQIAVGFIIRGEQKIGCDINACDILGQCALHDLIHICREKLCHNCSSRIKYAQVACDLASR